MAAPNAIAQRWSSCAVIHAPRRQHPTMLHSREAIITMAILAPTCGAHHWVEIEQWVYAHHQWLAEFLDRQHGIPSHDTCGRVLSDRAEAVMARGGTTIRRSWEWADGQGAIHGVRAWASAHELVLAPCQVDDKRYEITACPEWLARLNLQGHVVTSEALGGLVAIARQLIDHGGASGLSLTENQPGWHREGAALWMWLQGSHPRDAEGGAG